MVCLEGAEILYPESILNIRFGILGNRAAGAHDLNAEEPIRPDGSTQSLIFKSSLLLQRPVLDPCFAVGFLPLSSTGLQVGQLVSMRWRVERLKSLEKCAASENNVSVSPDSLLSSLGSGNFNVNPACAYKLLNLSVMLSCFTVVIFPFSC